jgi:hypothetical protein
MPAGSRGLASAPFDITLPTIGRSSRLTSGRSTRRTSSAGGGVWCTDRCTRCTRRGRSRLGAPVWPMLPTAGAPLASTSGAAIAAGRGAGAGADAGRPVCPMLPTAGRARVSSSGCARSHALTLPRINRVLASCLIQDLPFRGQDEGRRKLLTTKRPYGGRCPAEIRTATDQRMRNRAVRRGHASR